MPHLRKYRLTFTLKNDKMISKNNIIIAKKSKGKEMRKEFCDDCD